MAQSTLHEAPATLAQAQQLGLLDEEFDRICELLGRTPNFTELSMFSVMWSEHCSYKNSIFWLKKLPKDGARVMAGAGAENAGLLDIGDEWAVAFKIESHNHPSAIEPFQGAATGVGGIHRDVFTMGARPIATLNSLRFGDPSLPKTQHLVQGVIAGIAHYGNSFGVPTVGGEMYFDPCYNTNPLVNAMSVGVVRHDAVVGSAAKGPGNPVFIVGSATGKDGIHGASFASADITEDSAEQLPSVQVGDPFAEKLLLEASLEAIATGAVVGMQDMGAAGISCSTSEMSEKGKVGMDIDLTAAPTRQENMKAFELLLSESQERMLVVGQAGREKELLRVFDKWDLTCVQIGQVTEGQDVVFRMHDQEVARIPAEALVLGGDAPVYHRDQKKPSYLAEVAAYSDDQVVQPKQLEEACTWMLQRPNIASKHRLVTEYDSMVGAANLTTNAAADAAVVRVNGTQKALAMTTDCNSRHVYLDPHNGTALAVSEAARNLVCTGARPLGITNCLNFGNPYNPEVYYQFAQAVLGMKLACETFDLPVTGGNVSFYNQGPDGAVFPTPTIGMVGLIEPVTDGFMTYNFKQAGDLIYLLGEEHFGLGGSEYVYGYHGILHSSAPYVNLEEERRLQRGMLRLIENELIQSAHDCSDGGLWVTLCECAFPGEFGFSVDWMEDVRQDAYLFSEAGGRVVVSISPKKQTEFEQMLATLEIPFHPLGSVSNGPIKVGSALSFETKSLKDLYHSALTASLGRDEASGISAH